MRRGRGDLLERQQGYGTGEPRSMFRRETRGEASRAWQDATLTGQLDLSCRLRGAIWTGFTETQSPTAC